MQASLRPQWVQIWAISMRGQNPAGGIGVQLEQGSGTQEDFLEEEASEMNHLRSGTVE